jgi:nucleoside-diphosphate-sugar epimerase
MTADPVLVTGAAGFIGSHLTRRLASLGAPVRAVDVQPGPPAPQGAGIDYHRIDLRETGRLEPLLDGVRTVYHLASVHLEVHAGEAEFEAVNVRAVADLVAACARRRVGRLIHTSSVGIFGHVARPPAGEDAPKNPQSPYERTKLAGEQAALREAAAAGLPIVVLRPAWVYGPGCPRTAKLARALRRGRFFFVGTGDNLRHPLYIDDMIDAFLAAAEAPPGALGKTYIIAGPRYLTLRELVDTFARVLGVSSPRLALPRRLAYLLGMTAETAFAPFGKEPPFSRRSLAFFANDNAFDTSAAASGLGYRAGTDFEAGLRLTFAPDAARQEAR